MTDASATPAPAAAAPASPAPAPVHSGNGWLKGLAAVALVLCCILAALLLYGAIFYGGNTQKIGPGNRIVETILPTKEPIAPVVKSPQKAKIVCANGTTVEVDNEVGNGVNVTVAGCQEKVVVPSCGANCPPRIMTPPCQTNCPPRIIHRPVQPQPRLYRPAPVVQQCFVRVDLTQADRVSPYHKGMPLVITDKASGRVLGQVTLAGGQNRVAVPCNSIREICLTLNGQRTEVLAPDWFARNRGNLSQGGVFNPNAPIIFSSRT